MTTQVPAVPPYAELISALEGVRAQPLWDRYHRITTRQPMSPARAYRWRWSDMAPLVDRAIRDVSMEDAERRVLLFSNPDAPASVDTLRNLSGGLQTLLPGEVAGAHRHSLAALRFVMEGNGAVTSVNDDVCPMSEGDLILTPSWTWHEHRHPGDGRMVWFDGLDLPLAHQLDAMFFELAGPGLQAVAPAPARASVAPGEFETLLPDASCADAAGGPASQFRYDGRRAREALEHAVARPDASQWLRYANAQTGGPVLPTLDCYLLRLRQNCPTHRRRSTAGAICVVASGEGRSVIGESEFEWKRNDVFTLPHWQWATHVAQSADARLFLMTDREFLAGMGYLREEETDS